MVIKVVSILKNLAFVSLIRCSVLWVDEAFHSISNCVITQVVSEIGRQERYGSKTGVYVSRANVVAGMTDSVFR
jgi:hypothetical protein